MEKRKEYSAGGAICRKDENGEAQLLLIRVRKNGYELPKGHIETRETEIQAAHRECIEEIGIESKITPKEELGRISYSFVSKETEIEKNVVYFKFHCVDEFVYSKPKNTREVIWISQQHITGIELVNEELRPIIERAFQ